MWYSTIWGIPQWVFVNPSFLNRRKPLLKKRLIFDIKCVGCKIWKKNRVAHWRNFVSITKKSSRNHNSNQFLGHFWTISNFWKIEGYFLRPRTDSTSSFMCLKKFFWLKNFFSLKIFFGWKNFFWKKNQILPVLFWSLT